MFFVIKILRVKKDVRDKNWSRYKSIDAEEPFSDLTQEAVRDLLNKVENKDKK